MTVSTAAIAATPSGCCVSLPSVVRPSAGARAAGEPVAHSGDRRFDTTRWSLVLAAGDSGGPGAREALDALCRTYWPPIYAYLRRRGWDARQAEDLTQGFFLKLLEHGGVGRARAERGKFRTFLLSSLKNYLSDEHDRETALKRGGGSAPLSLDARDDEEWLVREPSHDESPERLFDRRWASTVIARALARLEETMLGSVGPERFAALRPFLTKGPTGAYAEVSRTLGIGESAVRVGVHRMRRQFGELLREEVAQTVESQEDVEDELRHLQRIVRG